MHDIVWANKNITGWLNKHLKVIKWFTHKHRSFYKTITDSQIFHFQLQNLKDESLVNHMRRVQL